MKLFFKKVNKSRGFTLVETLAAIAIFTASILAVMAVLANSISDTNYAKKKITAAYLAQEGIEYVRNMRDSYILGAYGGTWVSFKDANINDLETNNPSPSIDDANFSRLITKTPVPENPDNEVKIISTVSWTQGSGTYNITFSENLFNWIE